MKKEETALAPNLLTLCPRRNLQWEESADRIILIIPKFRNKYVVRYFVPLLAKPNFRLKLDQYGSFTWKAADGKTTVKEIGERMAQHFGEPLDDDLYGRISKFIRRLSRDEFLLLDSGTN